MIQQRPGDILEIGFEGKWYYLVVVTKIVMFGGNIVYAFHGDGSRIEHFEPTPKKAGFNICTDLLLPKKEGEVRRIGKVEDANEYLVLNLMKGCHEHRPGMKAREWWLYTIDPPQEFVKRVSRLSRTEELAMDRAMTSFDLAAEKIIARYSPEKNPFIERRRFLGLFS